MIIADSTAWVDYINRPHSGVGPAMHELLDEDRLLMIGVVLTELLRGLRPTTVPGTEDLLLALPFMETTKAIWVRAGRIAQSLEEAGTPIPFADVVIAATVIDGDLELLTRDKHFERIPGLRLYQWEEADA